VASSCHVDWTSGLRPRRSSAFRFGVRLGLEGPSHSATRASVSRCARRTRSRSSLCAARHPTGSTGSGAPSLAPRRGSHARHHSGACASLARASKERPRSTEMGGRRDVVRPRRKRLSQGGAHPRRPQTLRVRGDGKSLRSRVSRLGGGHASRPNCGGARRPSRRSYRSARARAGGWARREGRAALRDADVWLVSSRRVRNYGWRCRRDLHERPRSVRHMESRGADDEPRGSWCTGGGSGPLGAHRGRCASHQCPGRGLLRGRRHTRWRSAYEVTRGPPPSWSSAIPRSSEAVDPDHGGRRLGISPAARFGERRESAVDWLANLRRGREIDPKQVLLANPAGFDYFVLP